MLSQFNIKNFILHGKRCVKLMMHSVGFFRKHKLWRGIFKHKWIFLLTIILSGIFTFVLFSNLYEYIFSSDSIDGLTELSEKQKSISKDGNKSTAVFGGSKFILLMFLEVVIFHFSVRTLEILNKEAYTTTFGMFVKAEIRMIKVLIRGYLYSLLAQIVLSIVLVLSPFDFIFPTLMFVVHAYFIGYSFFDNYNEQQKLNIKDSDICIRHHSGAATALGIAASIGLMIPIIGALVVPVLGAITANLYGFKYNIEKAPIPSKLQESPSAQT